MLSNLRSLNVGEIPASGGSSGEGIGYPLQYSWTSLVVLMVQNPPAMRETWVPSLGWEDPLETRMATHSSIFIWRIPKHRGTWRATVHSVSKESDMTERVSAHKAHAVFDSKSDAHLLNSFEDLRFFTFCIHPHIFAGFLLCAR